MRSLEIGSVIRPNVSTWYFVLSGKVKRVSCDELFVVMALGTNGIRLGMTGTIYSPNTRWVAAASAMSGPSSNETIIFKINDDAYFERIT